MKKELGEAKVKLAEQEVPVKDEQFLIDLEASLGIGEVDISRDLVSPVPADPKEVHTYLRGSEKKSPKTSTRIINFYSPFTHAYKLATVFFGLVAHALWKYVGVPTCQHPLLWSNVHVVSTQEGTWTANLKNAAMRLL